MYSDKTLIRILFIFLSIFLLSACVEVDNTLEYSEYDDSPIPQGDLDILENMTFQDVSHFITDNVNKTTKEFSHGGLYDLDIFENKLLLKNDRHKKAYNNIFVNITIELNYVPNEEIEEITTKYNDKIYEAFAGEELEILKIKSILIYYVIDGDPIGDNYNHEITFTNIHKTILGLTSPQDPESENADKLIFDFIEKNIENIFTREHEKYDITHMGIKDNKHLTNIIVYIYLGKDFEGELEIINSTVYKEVKENDTLIEYFKINDIKYLEINYDAIWYRDEPLTYHFEIN